MMILLTSSSVGFGSFGSLLLRIVAPTQNNFQIRVILLFTIKCDRRNVQISMDYLQ